jgi:hypothetical protein
MNLQNGADPKISHEEGEAMAVVKKKKKHTCENCSPILDLEVQKV